MKKDLQEEIGIVEVLQPETKLENLFLKNPHFVKGLFWGKPRYGHPEGEVIFHIREVLDNIDKLNIDGKAREELRLVAFVHDTFKYLEIKNKTPRDWSKHHGVYARKFLNKYLKDEKLLDLVELHDEAFYVWRLENIYQKKEEARSRHKRLLNRIGDQMQLYYLFFKCDTLTGDKNLNPMYWFEETMPSIKIVSF